jgi:hypothetical protein
MGWNMKPGRIVLYAAMGIGLLVVGLIGAAWFRPTPVYTLAAADHPDCLTPPPDHDVLIGLAVSGGGSRAALFAAGAMEALAKIRVGPEQRSLLEQVSYISSVSGGSMASSYFVTRKPSRAVPVLTPDGVMTKEYQDFFSRFKEDMKGDLEGQLLRRQLFRNRWFNPAWTAWSLAEVLDESFLNGMTFKELAHREAQGDSPFFLVNTTLYNNGRRFVLSTIPRDTLSYDPFPDLNRVPGVRTLDEESERLLRARWESLISVKPEDLKLDICRIRVAGAVVGSMSFPPVVGPISFRVEGRISTGMSATEAWPTTPEANRCSWCPCDSCRRERPGAPSSFRWTVPFHLISGARNWVTGRKGSRSSATTSRASRALWRSARRRTGPGFSESRNGTGSCRIPASSGISRFDTRTRSGKQT